MFFNLLQSLLKEYYSMGDSTIFKGIQQLELMPYYFLGDSI